MSDVQRRVPLEVLDPGTLDPGYWERFQDRVMRSVRPLLAQRRQARVTMEEVMLSWSRLVLPVAMAAMAASLLLVPDGPGSETPEIAGVEEVLALPTDGGEPLPSFLHSDEVVDRDLVLFAVEGF